MPDDSPAVQSLLDTQSEADRLLIQSKLIPWLHPVLRPKLNKALLWTVLNLFLIALELLHIVKPTYPYLFPVLLTLALCFQWLALNQFRRHIFVLDLDHTQLRLWEGSAGTRQDDQTSVPTAKIKSVEIAEQSSGRNKHQPALLVHISDSEPLYLAAGLDLEDLEIMQSLIEKFREAQNHV